MQAILFQVNWTFLAVFYNQFCDQVCCLVAFSMELVKEQRIYIKFCFKVGKTATETHNMFCDAYRDDALNQTMTSECFRQSKNGKTSAGDDEQSG
jgi:hypothetical protein